MPRRARRDRSAVMPQPGFRCRNRRSRRCAAGRRATSSTSTVATVTSSTDFGLTSDDVSSRVRRPTARGSPRSSTDERTESRHEPQADSVSRPRRRAAVAPAARCAACGGDRGDRRAARAGPAVAGTIPPLHAARPARHVPDRDRAGRPGLSGVRAAVRHLSAIRQLEPRLHVLSRHRVAAVHLPDLRPAWHGTDRRSPDHGRPLRRRAGAQGPA